MKKILLKLSSIGLAVVLSASIAKAGHLTNKLLVSGKMDGAQEVPAVTTSALGIATAIVNSTRDTVCINISTTGLSGAITGIHIHEGVAGTNGTVFYDLTPFVSGNRIQASLTGANASATNISKLLRGQFYVNVHTAANPNGEIRGQLNLETDWSFSVDANGLQEVPPVVTTAYAVGAFNLSKDLSKLTYNVVAQGLSGAITGAHLHFGAMGQSGGVSNTLTVSGNVLSGTISNPSTALIDSLMASKIYLNIHTSMNPNGEIRAQLMNTKRYLYFDASLNGAQEVPAVATSATGSATIKLNTTFDTLWFDVANQGLSGAISGAHFHTGALGTNGGVAYDVTPNINGNRIMGMITGSALNNTLISNFITGDIYLNLHTSANPNGEIRGQVYRLAREGYTFSMDGMQEVPSVTTSASGSGMVSIDRSQDNAHIMLVASGLTSTGIHLHKAVAGQNGGVIYDLTPFYMNNGAFLYWSSGSATPFAVSNSVQFRNDSVYVNIHTSANANGEIRGQVRRGFECYGAFTSVTENSSTQNSFKVYPNPVKENITVSVISEKSENVSITIMDILGNKVYSETTNLSSGNNTKTFNMSTYSNGIYFLQVKGSAQTMVQKIIKE